MTLTNTQKEAAIDYLLKNASREALQLVYRQREQPDWWIEYHFSLGQWVRKALREGGFTRDDQTLDSEWPALIVAAAERFAQRQGQLRPALPALPSRLQSATLAAADNLATIAAAEGLTLVGERGEAAPHLLTILYTLRERCALAQSEARPGDQRIEPAEIAAVLELLGQWMVSEGIEDLAGYNASWFKDAARVVEQLMG